MNQYEGLAEIVRGPFRAVNHYLKHDYRLLAVMGVTYPRKKPDGQWYVHRGVEYVLGRTADTPRAPLIPKPKEEQAQEGDAECAEVSQSASE